jgi:hypothetical protein
VELPRREVDPALPSGPPPARPGGPRASLRSTSRAATALVAAQEPGVVSAYGNAADAFTAAVQVEASDDPKIPLEMGLALRATPADAPEVTVPTGVAVVFVKKTHHHKLFWDAVPGAALYVAQMKLEGAPDDAWTTLFGPGASRQIPTLPAGQHYVMRVQALGLDGVPTAWSETVLFVAK